MGFNSAFKGLTQTLRSTHRAYLRSLYGAQEKKKKKLLFPYTALMIGFDVEYIYGFVMLGGL